MADHFENDAVFLRSIPAELTPRERDVLLGLIRGQGEKQIAQTLEISVHTVHVYMKGVYEQYGVHTRTELFSKCIFRLLQVYSVATDIRSDASGKQSTELAIV
jgi:DNA-binding NarL/FixJ family response regulator